MRYAPEARLQDQRRVGADEHRHRAAASGRAGGAGLVDSDVTAHHQGVATVPFAVRRQPRQQHRSRQRRRRKRRKAQHEEQKVCAGKRGAKITTKGARVGTYAGGSPQEMLFALAYVVTDEQGQRARA